MKKNHEVIITSSSLETQEAGKEFVKRLKPGDIICLYGDLGSGKTTFAQGIAKGLGITSRIISPTFVLIRTHNLQLKTKNSKTKKLHHVDLYRLENEESIKNLGLSELFQETEAFVVIEWAEKLGNFLPKERWDVTFEYLNELEREITTAKIDHEKM